MKTLAWFMIILSSLQSTDFKKNQLLHSRVKNAFEEKESVVKSYFEEKGLAWFGFHLFLRAFKKEQSIEAWIKEGSKEEFVLLHTYSFCTTSGVLGPKRKEGDLQIPEGIYQINHFNPVSNFHLSLGINYPNASDKILSDRNSPGGSIYIHGNCVTIGCIPITDNKIKELYVLAVEARNNGQEKIPVHIFPDRLEEGIPEHLAEEFSSDQKTKTFWKNLQEIYLDFKSTKEIRPVKVNRDGVYYF